MSATRGEPAEPIGAPERVSTDPSHWPPPVEGRTEYLVSVLFDERSRLQGQQTLDTDGRLVGFSLEAQVLHDGHWCVIARVDTAHDKVHSHEFDRTGTKILERERDWWPLTCHKDVDDGYLKGEDWLTEEWERIERRWARGR